MREFCGNLVSIDRLPGVHSFQGGNDAVVVLFQQIAPGAEFQGTDDVFVIQKGSQQEDLRLGIKGKDLCRRSQPVHLFHPDIHQKDVRTERIVESDRLFSVLTRTADLNPAVGFQNGFQSCSDKKVVVDDQNSHKVLLFMSPYSGGACFLFIYFFGIVIKIRKPFSA